MVSESREGNCVTLTACADNLKQNNSLYTSECYHISTKVSMEKISKTSAYGDISN